MIVGPTEKLILKAVANLNGLAYGLSVIEEVSALRGRQATRGVVYPALKTLRRKKLIKDRLCKARPFVKGPRVRRFTITPAGMDWLKQNEA